MNERPELDQQVAASLERTFVLHAEDAPSAVGLADRVRWTRRRQVVWRVGAGAAVAVAAAIAVPMILSGGPAVRPPADPGVAGPGVVGRAPVATRPPVVPADDGWRWESYGGIELQVPADWGYGISGQVMCGMTEAPPPYVGYPGAVTAPYCDDPAPAAIGARLLWFDTALPDWVDEPPAGWVRKVTEIGGVTISIQFDDAAAVQRILDSARLVTDVDVNGCAPDHPLSTAPDLRPAPAWDVATDQPILGASVCRYVVRQDDEPTAHPPLLGSARLDAASAAALRAAVAAAPAGSGPNDPASCLPDYAYGNQLVLVRFETASGVRELVVRYDGCNFHGEDDGTTVRELTADVVGRIFRQPLLPNSFGGELDDLFAPLWEATRTP